MVQFTLSDNISSFRFSAKTSTITLPKAIEKMLPEDQELIKQFTVYVRDTYIKKVVQFTTTSVGQKICAIQLRHESINEAIHHYQEKLTPEVFNPIYSQFQSLSQTTRSSRRNSVLEKPKVKSSTSLDHIEDPF
jgi:hypothetical protein